MKKLVSLLLALALLCTVAFVGVYAEEEGEEENLLEIVGITFDSVVEGEVVEFVRGGAESNAVLIDGDYMEGPQATPNHQAKGIVLVQNTRCNEAGVYPEYTYTLELKDKDTFDRLKIGFYEYFMAMIGLPKDNSIGVEASEDGSDWTFVGDYEFEGEALKDEVAGNVYVIDLGKAVTAKYVRLTFAFGDSPFGTAEYGNSEKVIWEWHGFTEFGVIGADTVVIDDPEPGEPSEPAEDPSEPSEPAETTDPENYLWLVNDGTGAAPCINYAFDASLLDGSTVDVEALVMFEGCAGDGSAYLNIYPYNGNTLLNWNDYATQKTCEDGVWTKVEKTDWDLSKDGSNPDSATVGVGFWNATGTLKLAYIKISQNGQVIWSVDYTEGFDPTAEGIAYIQGIDADNEDAAWGVIGYDPAPVNPDPVNPDPVNPDPEVPVNGDAGIIALAVVSVIALGGAVIVKKSK